MRISEAVRFAEDELERLRNRERELVGRCGELLERARKAEEVPKDEDPRKPAGIPRSGTDSFLAFVVAADNVVARGGIGDAETLHDLAEARRNLDDAWMGHVRRQYADVLRRDAEKSPGRD